MYYRDRFDVPLTDEQVKNVEYYRPKENSEEIKYLKERRLKLGGYLPEDLHLLNQSKHHLKIFLTL